MSNIQELPRRNAESVMQSLARMETKLAEQQERIDLLNRAVATVTERVIQLEQGLAMVRITRMGSGATVR